MVVAGRQDDQYGSAPLGHFEWAEAIGLAQDLGSIERGKLADLVVLRKNPLDNIRNTTDIEYVMKDGELFEGGTPDQVWPRQKPLAPLWWWKDQPGADPARHA